MADPGFHVGGHAPIGGCRPPTWALFGENVCENERIGSHSTPPLDPPMSPLAKSDYLNFQQSIEKYCVTTLRNDDGKCISRSTVNREQWYLSFADFPLNQQTGKPANQCTFKSSFFKAILTKGLHFTMVFWFDY